MPASYQLKNVGAIGGFLTGVLLCYSTLCVGWPLRLVSKTKLWRAWLDLLKRSFGLLLISLMRIANPTTAKIYSAHENQGFKVDANGLLTSSLSPRAVLIANHQIYSDWVYLWWFGYTADLHGAFVFALKRSLRRVPIFGWSMRAFRFMFMSRKWALDEANIKEVTSYLAEDRTWPVWLTVFPEGTVFNKSTWKHTEEYAQRIGLPGRLLPKHVLLPRAKGLYASLRGLGASVPVLYDITVVYEPLVPEGQAAEQYYSLGRTFLQGRGAKQLKLHIREFPISTVPYKESEEVFTRWLYERWVEKDEIYRQLAAGELESQLRATADVRLRSWFELYQVVNVPLMVLLVVRLAWKHLL